MNEKDKLERRAFNEARGNAYADGRSARHPRRPDEMAGPAGSMQDLLSFVKRQKLDCSWCSRNPAQRARL